MKIWPNLWKLTRRSVCHAKVVIVTSNFWSFFFAVNTHHWMLFLASGEFTRASKWIKSHMCLNWHGVIFLIELHQGWRQLPKIGGGGGETLLHLQAFLSSMRLCKTCYVIQKKNIEDLHTSIWNSNSLAILTKSSSSVNSLRIYITWSSCLEFLVSVE